MSDLKTLNFARTILQDQSYPDITDDHILTSAEALLHGWMTGEHSLDRPKLYDHYALVLVALLRKVHTLEEKIESLSKKHGSEYSTNSD